MAGVTMGAVALLLCSSCILIGSTPVPMASLKAEFNKQRSKLLMDDEARGLGAGLKLSNAEQIVDNYILGEKRKLMDESRENRTKYWPAASFYESKPMINAENVFNIIKTMPKGAALHIHDIAITSLDWLVSNVTYRDNVWMCMDSDNFAILTYSKKKPDILGCTWSPVKSKRSNYSSPSEFDEWLKRNISYLSIDPLKAYETVDDAWDRFNKYFSQVIGVLFYAPVMRDYYRQALVEFQADNVQYIELRSQLYGYFDFDENDQKVVHDAEFGIQLYKSVTDEFKQENPDFIGANIIMSGLRMKPLDVIRNEVKTAIGLHKTHSDIFLGYDLVGQEDPLKPLQFYLEALLYPSTLDPPYHLPYYFHAAETNWQGTQVDENLIDALLLNTTRIGHAYGLSKHPALMELVKKRGIALEINPISNQILGLVKDMRNHAMVPLMADDFPVVISSDDPGSWEATPLSHDFYVAFMNLAGRHTGLSFLKKLAMNSIQYSSLQETEKKAAWCKWETKWQNFINETVKKLNDNDADLLEMSNKCTLPPFLSATTIAPNPNPTNNGSSTIYSDWISLFVLMSLNVFLIKFRLQS